MSLFIIPLQSVLGKSFAKPLAKAFRNTSTVPVQTDIVNIPELEKY